MPPTPMDPTIDYVHWGRDAWNAARAAAGLSHTDTDWADAVNLVDPSPSTTPPTSIAATGVLEQKQKQKKRRQNHECVDGGEGDEGGKATRKKTIAGGTTTDEDDGLPLKKKTSARGSPAPEEYPGPNLGNPARGLEEYINAVLNLRAPPYQDLPQDENMTTLRAIILILDPSDHAAALEKDEGWNWLFARAPGMGLPWKGSEAINPLVGAICSPHGFEYLRDYLLAEARTLKAQRQILDLMDRRNLARAIQESTKPGL